MKKMKRRGFTLIELLAVIVILAIIALIATPIIVGVINDAKKNAFKDTAYGVIEAGKLYYAGEFGNDSFAGKTFDFTENVDELKLSGEKPAGGSFVISKEGKYALAIYNKDKSFCATKGYEENEIKISTYKEDDCKINQSSQLAVQAIADKNTSGNTEGLFTDDFGNIRYRGSNSTVKNYVTFNHEVWRIIGIFNGKVKLIREEDIVNTEDASHPNVFLWDSNDTNNWSTASLQIYLNTIYYDSLATTSKNMLVEEKYNLGGIATTEIDKKTAYELERGTVVYRGNPTEWTGKIGLMYISDYGYAAGDACKQILWKYSDSTCTTNNWLYNKSLYGWWAITSSSDWGSDVASVFSSGYAGSGITAGDLFAIRPVLYLNPSVQIVSGDGTSGNPYILK